MPRRRLTEEVIHRALGWAYDKAITGLPLLESAEEMAHHYMYMRRGGTRRRQVNSLIRWQVAKASTAGFLTGLGGLLTMPVTLPADITIVFYVQLRMVAAIAYIGGYNARSDQVRTLAYACLCGSAASDVLKDIGIKVGTKLTEQMIKKIPGEAIKAINKAIGFRLVTKFGSRGIINFGKMVPIIGGFIGGTFDGAATKVIGNVSRNLFIG